MNIKLWTIAQIMIGALVISGCQTPVAQNQATQTINVPVVEVILDSDGDGVPDDLDQCPGTPMNILTDKRGCPSWGDEDIPLKMEYRAFFAKGSSELSKEYQLALDNLAQKLQEYETATMLIIGTASVDEINETSSAKTQPNSLSRNRVLIVKNYLILKHEINPNRLSTFSCGTSTPSAPSDTEEQRSLNRRVYGLAQEIINEELYNQQIYSYAKLCVEIK